MKLDMKKLANAVRANGEDEEKSDIPTKKCKQEDMIKFLKENPNPTDEEFHEWAEGKGFDVPSAEAKMYELATMYVRFLQEGEADDKDVDAGDVDPKELEMGKKVELEHIDDEDVAEEIALDHLAEMPDYYTELKKMEEKGARLVKGQAAWSHVQYLIGLIEKYMDDSEMLDAVLDILGVQRSEEVLEKIVQTHPSLSYERGEDLKLEGRRTAQSDVYAELRSELKEVFWNHVYESLYEASSIASYTIQDDDTFADKIYSEAQAALVYNMGEAADAFANEFIGWVSNPGALVSD